MPDLRPARGPAPTGVLRWAPVGLLGLMLLALTRTAGSGIADPDTLWHVLAGDHLRATGQFAGPDPLSPFTTEPWVLTQWLPELGLSIAHDWGGLAAVTFLADLGRVAVCLAVYVGCRRQAGPLAAALVTAVTVLGSSASLSPRPQLVGFALLAVTTSAWLSTTRDLRVRWWLVPLTWAWASSHGTWVVGVMLGVAVVAGLAADRRVDLRLGTRLLAVPLLSGLAALLTPLGPRVLETFGTVRAVSPYIQEWRRPGLTEPATLALLALALAVLATWVVRRDLVTWARAAVLLVGLGWGLSTARGVALGAIIVAPLAAEAVDRLLGRARPERGREPAVVAALVAVAVAVGAVLAWTGPREPVGVPTALTPALRALPAGAVVYDDDLLGGWLLWSFPELQPTADTRAELYGPEAARAYLRALRAEEGWQASVEQHRPAAALIGSDTPLAQALVRDARWTVVGRDRGYLLLQPPPG
ncbi:hypothetical protein SAMN04489867_1913 [Pedococcus dokdonensis]|uniref:Dolichyl-phosphate-mannose-protein mannosyltransferase n=1 Tax=Pedococcus dokdonensis TaxID=443156 RepID=A0A1H0RCB3_9MICO|nr:hypothetical protein [Pedococcus dokdonensis]SDP27081.1 hypothetical protein SAMN04489867_1913 [Pedococcus dokdonensis]